MAKNYDKVMLSLVDKELLPTVDFHITPDLLLIYLEEYKAITKTNGVLTKREARYCLKLAALSLLKYKRSLKLSLTEGFVYLISNYTWKDYYKVGMSSFPKERLAAFQTYSPFRDYKLHHWSFWFDKRKGESFIHSKYASVRDHEWIKLQESELISLYEKVHKLSGMEEVLNKIY